MAWLVVAALQIQSVAASPMQHIFITSTSTGYSGYPWTNVWRTPSRRAHEDYENRVSRAKKMALRQRFGCDGQRPRDNATLTHRTKHKFSETLGGIPLVRRSRVSPPHGERHHVLPSHGEKIPNIPFAADVSKHWKEQKGTPDCGSFVKNLSRWETHERWMT